MTFPASPTHGQIFEGYYWDNNIGAWYPNGFSVSDGVGRILTPIVGTKDGWSFPEGTRTPDRGYDSSRTVVYLKPKGDPTPTTWDLGTLSTSSSSFSNEDDIGERLDLSEGNQIIDLGEL